MPLRTSAGAVTRSGVSFAGSAGLCETGGALVVELYGHPDRAQASGARVAHMGKPSARSVMLLGNLWGSAAEKALLSREKW